MSYFFGRVVTRCRSSVVKALLVLTTEAEGRRVIASIFFRSIRAWSRSETIDFQLMSARERIGRRKIETHFLWLIGTRCGSILCPVAGLSTLAKSVCWSLAQDTFLWLVGTGCCNRQKEDDLVTDSDGDWGVSRSDSPGVASTTS